MSPVKNGNILIAVTLMKQMMDDLHNPLGFLRRIRKMKSMNLRTSRIFRLQFFGKPAAVDRNQFIGCFKNLGVAAVIPV